MKRNSNKHIQKQCNIYFTTRIRKGQNKVSGNSSIHITRTTTTLQCFLNTWKTCLSPTTTSACFLINITHWNEMADGFRVKLLNKYEKSTAKWKPWNHKNLGSFPPFILSNDGRHVWIIALLCLVSETEDKKTHFRNFRLKHCIFYGNLGSCKVTYRIFPLPIHNTFRWTHQVSICVAEVVQRNTTETEIDEMLKFKLETADLQIINWRLYWQREANLKYNTETCILRNKKKICTKALSQFGHVCMLHT